MKFRKPLAYWPAPQDFLAQRGIRIGDHVTFEGSPGVWYYGGGMIITAGPPDVPRYLADQHIAALRQRLHRK